MIWTRSVNFCLFETDEEGNPTTRTREKAGYLDVAPLDQGENARRDMILTLEEMGFEIESSHHEDAPAQHEVDFKQAQGVKVADQIVTFRSTVRTIAQRHGLHATFMPKPRTDLPGSALSFKYFRIPGRKKHVCGSSGGERIESGSLLFYCRTSVTYEWNGCNRQSDCQFI